MAIDLTCMNCWSQVSAEDSDRGRTIRCPVCEAEITVPGGPPPTDATETPSRPAMPPVAKPVMAMPVKAAPVARAAEKKSGDVPFRFDTATGESGGKSSRRRRDEADENDEDDGRPARKKGGSKVLPILALVFGCLLVFCIAPIGVIAWKVYSTVNEFERAAANGEFDPGEFEEEGEVAPARLNPPNANSRPADRTIPPTKTGIAQANWRKPRDTFPPAADRMKEGFQVLMPKDARASRTGALVDGKAVQSLTFTADEGGIDYRAEVYEVPGELTLDAEAFVRRHYQNRVKIEPGSKPVNLFNKPGVELTATRNGRTPETIRATRVGNKVFVFAAHHDPDRVKEYAGQNVAFASSLFFNSALVMYNANVPQLTLPTPKIPAPTRPSISPPAVPGGLRYITKIEPFAVAVALPAKKEVLTFAAPGSPPPNTAPPKGGVVRRYSAESFKLLGTFTLPSTAVYAGVVDEQAGRLYLAAARSSGTGAKASSSIPVGELRVYDLTEFTAGGDAPKPTATVPLGGGPIALDIAPDGSALYAAAITAIPSPRARTGRTKLIRFDPKTVSPFNELELPAVVTALRPSPDGKYVFAGESPGPALGAAATPPGNVTVIETASWKRLYSVPIPQGIVTEIRFVANDKAVVGAAKAGNEVKLYLVDAAGEATDLPTPLRFAASGFLAVTPDRKRLVTAVGGGGAGATGTEVFAVVPGGSALRSVANLPLAPGGMVTGPVVLTGEASHAVYGSGIVLDLAGTAEKP